MGTSHTLVLSARPDSYGSAGRSMAGSVPVKASRNVTRSRGSATVVPCAPYRVVTFEECLSNLRDFVARTRTQV